MPSVPGVGGRIDVSCRPPSDRTEGVQEASAQGDIPVSNPERLDTISGRVSDRNSSTRSFARRRARWDLLEIVVLTIRPAECRVQGIQNAARAFGRITQSHDQSPDFAATSLRIGPNVCNCAARRRCRFATATGDAAGGAEGAGAAPEAWLLRFTPRCRAGCDEIGERAEELVGARARHVSCGLPKDRRQANRKGPLIGPPVGAEPVVVAAHGSATFVMADLVSDGERQTLRPDVAMARKAAIDPDMGGGRP